MWLKPFIAALSALGLIWMIQLALFATLFSATFVVLREVFQILSGDGVGRVPARAMVALSCLLTFAFLARLQAAARRHGWVDRPAEFSND